MNFKDAYVAANNEINGDKSILTDISQKPIKNIYFKPVIGTAVAAVLCVVTVFLYPYIANPSGGEETPTETENVFIASEQTQGLIPAFDGGQPSAPEVTEENVNFSMKARSVPSTEEALEDTSAEDALYEVSEDLSAVTIIRDGEAVVLKITDQTQIVTQGGIPCAKQNLKQAEILNVHQGEGNLAITIVVKGE